MNQESLQENSFNQSLEEELTAEEELEISGYNPEQVALIDTEYLIQRDGEQAEPVDSSENPLVRGAIVALLVGGVMGFGWMAWSIFFAPKQIAKPIVTPKPTPSVFAEGSSDEAARLKAELALRNQASRTEKAPQQKPITPKPSTPTTVKRPTPVLRASTINPPPPRIIRERVSVPTPLSQPKTIQPKIVAASTQTKPIDPFERWKELATLGQQTVANGNIETSQSSESAQALPQNAIATNVSNDNTSSLPISSTNTVNTTKDTVSDATTKQATIPVVYVSDSKESTTNTQQTTQTPGEWGIVNRTPLTGNQNLTLTANESITQPMQVQIGTTAQGSVLVPMIWAPENKNQGRFAVRLQQDVLSTDNRVAIPKGAILITEVNSVSKANKLVQQSVIAIVYTNKFGQVKQQTIPAYAILIRGENNKPLIAQSIEDRGAAIAQQDILIGLLGAASRAGEVFNQNQTQSSTTVNNDGFSSQTIITGARKPDVLAAAVEGFFKPMQERLSKRADKTSNELENRPNVAIVPAGTKVSIFFNSFFEISR
jgi:Bacterial conjugation TrbI-like protein